MSVKLKSNLPKLFPPLKSKEILLMAYNKGRQGVYGVREGMELSLPQVWVAQDLKSNNLSLSKHNHYLSTISVLSPEVNSIVYMC
jgi:hypothetical protein